MKYDSISESIVLKILFRQSKIFVKLYWRYNRSHNYSQTFLKLFFKQKTMYSLEIAALYSIVAMERKKNFERENPRNFAFDKNFERLRKTLNGCQKL